MNKMTELGNKAEELFVFVVTQTFSARLKCDTLVWYFQFRQNVVVSWVEKLNSRKK